MSERRRLRTERLEHLDLRRAVGDMILAANDVRDLQVDVVDHARQQIEPAAVLAADDRIGQQLRVEPLRPADQVVPLDRRVMVEPEPPVWRTALGSRIVVRACARKPAAGRARAAPCGEDRAPRASRSKRRRGRPLSAARTRARRDRTAPTGAPPRRGSGSSSRDRRESPRRTPRGCARGRCRRCAGGIDRHASSRTGKLCSAVRMLPTWRRPVGDGAKRVTTLMSRARCGRNC